MPVTQSPNITVNQSIIQSDSTTTLSQYPAFYVGEFSWGPCNKPILIRSLAELSDTFGNPNENNLTDWHVAADYISRTGGMIIVRAVDSSARNAILSQYRVFSMILDEVSTPFKVGDVIIIRETNPLASGMPPQYPATDVDNGLYSFDTTSKLVVTSFNSDTNELNFYVEYDYTGPSGFTKSSYIKELIKNTKDKLINCLDGNPTVQVGTYTHDLIVPLPTTKQETFGVRKFEVLTVDVTENTYNITFTPNGDSWGSSRILLTSNLKLDTTDDFLRRNGSFPEIVVDDKPTSHFIARYPGELGNSLGVLFVQPGFDKGSSLWKGIYKTILDTLPSIGTSEYALNTLQAEVKDECHVVVFDVDGGITGESGTILEVYQNLSVIEGSKKNGITNFFVEKINSDSKWIYSLSSEWKPESPYSSPEYRLSVRETDPLFTIFSHSEYEFPQSDPVSLNVIPDFGVTCMPYATITGANPFTESRTNSSAQRLNSTDNFYGIDVDVLFEDSGISAVNRNDLTFSYTTGGLDVSSECLLSSPYIPDDTTVLGLANYDTQDFDNPTFTGLYTPRWYSLGGNVVSVLTFPDSSVNFPVDIDTLKDNITKTVTIANKWSGFSPINEYNNDISTYSIWTTETINRWQIIGVSGFGADVDRIPKNTKNTFVIPYIGGNGSSFRIKSRDSVVIGAWQSIPDTTRIDTIVAGDSTQIYKQFLVTVADKYNSVVFMSPNKEDMFSGKNTIERAKDIAKSAVSLTPSNKLFCDSGWYKKYDQFTNVYIDVPLNSIVAGNADSKAYPWSVFSGLSDGYLRNVSKLSLNADDKQVRDILYNASVNPIITVSSGSISLYGDKTLVYNTSILNRIPNRRALTFIEKLLSHNSKNYMFDVLDKGSIEGYKAMITRAMDEFVALGACLNYEVVCDLSNNNSVTYTNHEIHASVLVQFAETINYITVNLVATKQ